MGGGIAGVGAYGHFKCHARLVELALAGVQHGQVVVRLGQFGEFFGQFDERGNRFVGFSCFRQDHAFQKTHLRVAGFGHQELVHLGHRLGGLTGFEQTVDIGVVVCPREGGPQRTQQQPHGNVGLDGARGLGANGVCHVGGDGWGVNRDPYPSDAERSFERAGWGQNGFFSGRFQAKSIVSEGFHVKRL